MVSKQQIEHIARLARLGLNEKEKEKFSKDLSVILDYVKKLDEVETKNIEPIKQITRLKNAMRKDEKRYPDKQTKERILENVPEIKDGYVKVKTIL